jgi:hypothetical protein
MAVPKRNYKLKKKITITYSLILLNNVKLVERRKSSFHVNLHSAGHFSAPCTLPQRRQNLPPSPLDFPLVTRHRNREYKSKVCLRCCNLHNKLFTHWNSLPWEFNYHLVSSSPLCGIPKFHYHVHRSPPMDFTPSQLNTVPKLQTVFPFHAAPHQHVVYFSHISHASYQPL